MRLAGLCALLAGAMLGGHAVAEPVTHARLDRLERSYEVHADLTYVETTDVDVTLYTARGIAERQRGSKDFNPRSQTLQVVEAWVDQPDGSRVPVPASAIFTRPSEAAQDAPGFSSEMTTTLLYPQLRTGSRTHVRWRLTQNKPPLLGFSAWSEPPLSFPVGLGLINIIAPRNLTISWAARGGFEVTEQVDGEQRLIRARIANTRPQDVERGMVDTADFQPLFLATTLPRLEELGAIYWRQSHDRAQATPEIRALAERLGGRMAPREATRAVYDWVARNIRYVAVYLDPDDGWVPHSAGEVLRAGYGDCKDHVVLMQAMLAALGIPAEAALVDEGSRTRDLPLWVPQFNHAFLYLPQLGKFVNPTDPFAPFDSLDSLLAGKTVVVATPTGQVTHTPASRPEDNRYRIEARVSLAMDGSLRGASRITMSPNLESSPRSFVAAASSMQDLAERLLAATPEGGFGELHTSNPTLLSQPFDAVATWTSPHAVGMHGPELYMTVPVGIDFNQPQRLRRLLGPASRQHALLTAARDDQRVTTLALPAGLIVGRLPEPVSLTNAAGRYVATYTPVPGGVRVERELVIAHDLFAADQYSALADLFYAALEDARATIVLRRAQTEAQAH